MARQIHVSALRVGVIPLDPAQAHHLRNVLRLTSGQVVEVFDDVGRTAQATLVCSADDALAVRVEQIHEPARALEFSIAAAVPKGPRADWMVEKLSELGATTFIPLAAHRSVVLPERKSKQERWTRIATESAMQSRRGSVMKIGALMRVEELVASFQSGDEPVTAWYLSTAPTAMPIGQALSGHPSESLLLLIGPEGGWTDEEVGLFESAGMVAVSLTRTILRIETAAVGAAAIVSSLLRSDLSP